jgi:hypothetical protein
MPVYQAVQNAGSCRLADSRRNWGDRYVKATFCIYSFIMDELLLSVNTSGESAHR